ncbi:hypothetical protein HELRODRAFT_190829 [Helobdella robusta]|uniref:C2H2-type domain-containing protein n=1 Tax=Helobdella robusta TaxID=6412 RepID=T1FSB9_HELRO|nr:hypothetical protein HELRODRAFT_190829 [Helobdella robusta]ESO07967.1 hypothetical protein HELRODRAFT_190829 [Helobdella robusta]
MKMCDKESLKKLLSNAIPLLCKNGLPMHSSFRIDAMIGITIGSADASTLICFSETITPNCEPSLLEYAQQIDSDEFSISHHHHNNSSFNINRCVDDDESEQNSSAALNNSNEECFVDVPIKPEPADIEELAPQNHSLPLQRNKRNNVNSRRSKSSSVNYTTNDYNNTIENQSNQHYTQVKQELIDIADDDHVKDTSGGGADVENNQSYDHHLQNNEYNQSLSNVTDWNASQNDWNNGNTEFQQEQMTGYSNRVIKHSVKNKKSNKRFDGQKLNVTDAMTIDASAFIDTTNQAASGSTADYNNLMQDICEFVMSQSQKITDKSKPQSRTCHICHATLSNPLSLKNHIQGTHLALKLRRCNLCGETFKWTMQLARHKKRVHGGGTYLNVYNV